jgi:fido (protein-threonine AMPylation protein)
MAKQLNNYINELDKYWNAFSDPRIKGEHPKCLEIQEALASVFADMTKEDMETFLENFDESKLEQIAYPLEEVIKIHPFVESYVKY